MSFFFSIKTVIIFYHERMRKNLNLYMAVCGCIMVHGVENLEVSSLLGSLHEEWGIGRTAPILSLELPFAADLQVSLLGDFGADVDVD